MYYVGRHNKLLAVDCSKLKASRLRAAEPTVQTVEEDRCFLRARLTWNGKVMVAHASEEVPATGGAPVPLV